jgi:hypothetical protein
VRPRTARLRVRPTVLRATLKWRGKCGLTIHSSRSRFAARLNSDVGPLRMEISAKSRVVIASAVGASVAVAAALSQYRETKFLAQQFPMRRSEILTSYVVAWTIIAVASLFASIVLPVLNSFATGPKGALVVGILMPLVLFTSILPIYWYTYWGVGPGWHINISEIRRYTPPIAGIVGFVAYGLAGLLAARQRWQ